MKKTLETFEATHGLPKIKKLQHDLEVERTKVAALADVQGRVVIETAKDCQIRFGLIGDTHIGSLYFHEAAFAGLYDYFKSEGIDTVYHTGDVLDGHKIYKGQEFELLDLGIDAQIQRLVKVAPSGIKTRFITGNHDASFKALVGVHVGKTIQQACPSWEFLGEDQAFVTWQTPKGAYTLQLLHPGGGCSYAISYRLQKIIESLSGGTKPNMLATGHYHKSEALPSYRNVTGIQTGTTQKQTPFMARGGLAAHVGGWVVDVTVGETYNIVKYSFVAFYL